MFPFTCGTADQSFLRTTNGLLYLLTLSTNAVGFLTTPPEQLASLGTTVIGRGLTNSIPATTSDLVVRFYGVGVALRGILNEPLGRELAGGLLLWGGEMGKGEDGLSRSL